MKIIINIILGVVLLFVANTVILAFSPDMARVERSYVTTTANWGAKVRGQAQDVSLGPVGVAKVAA